MKKYIPLLILLIFINSCNEQNKTRPNSFAPKVTEAKGKWINPNSVEKPKTISAGIPVKVKAGTPKVNPTNLNIHIAGQPKITVAGLPKANTPGTDTFSLPKTIVARGKTKPAGIIIRRFLNKQRILRSIISKYEEKHSLPLDRELLKCFSQFRSKLWMRSYISS